MMNTISRSLLSAFALVSLAAGSAFGQAQGEALTSDQAAAAAARTSADVRAREADVAVADAQLDQATYGYIPKVTLTGRYLKLSEVDPVVFLPTFPPLTFPTDNWDFEANLTVPVSDYLLRISQSRAGAEASRDAAAQQRHAAALTAAANARIAYWAWARAELAIGIAQKALDQANQHHTDAQHAFDAGTATRADVLRVESQVAQAELALVRAQNAAVLGMSQLRTAMHDASGKSYSLGEDPHAELGDLEGAGDVDPLLKEAISQRPEILALGDSERAALEQARVARAGYFPRLDAIANVTDASPNQRIFPQADKFDVTWSVGVQLTWTITDLPGVAAQVRSAKARASAVEAQRAALIDGLDVEVRQAWLGISEAKAAIASTGRELKAAEESLRVRNELFRNGHATSTELTDAETDLTRARLDELNARIDLRVARVRLLHATGRDAR